MSEWQLSVSVNSFKVTWWCVSLRERDEIGCQQNTLKILVESQEEWTTYFLLNFSPSSAIFSQQAVGLDPRVSVYRCGISGQRSKFLGLIVLLRYSRERWGICSIDYRDWSLNCKRQTNHPDYTTRWWNRRKIGLLVSVCDGTSGFQELQLD